MILVSNDDGVHAPGLKALAQALLELDEVVVVAPDQNQSASSHSLTLDMPLRCHQWKPGVFSVNGTPTDCVHLAIHALLKERPRLVVSGINLGGNLGEDVIYSGTVAAAMEGTIIGVPSLAISHVGDANQDFEMSASIAVKVARRMLEKGLPPGVLLNVNVPNRPAEELRGFCICPQGKRIYSGTIEERFDPRGKTYYWIGGEDSRWEEIENTDLTKIAEGYVTITPLKVDLTETGMLASLSDWDF